MMPADSSPTN